MRFRGNHQRHVPRPTGKKGAPNVIEGIPENMVPNSEWSRHLTRVQNWEVTRDYTLHNHKRNCWNLSLRGHRDVQTEELHQERRPPRPTPSLLHHPGTHFWTDVMLTSTTVQGSEVRGGVGRSAPKGGDSRRSSPGSYSVESATHHWTHLAAPADPLAGSKLHQSVPTRVGPTGTELLPPTMLLLLTRAENEVMSMSTPLRERSWQRTLHHRGLRKLALNSRRPGGARKMA